MIITLNEWLLIAMALGLIGAVNWYFLGPRRAQRVATTGGGVQEVTITVNGGYSPSVVDVEAGRPLRLTFDRREDNPCSEEVVFPTLSLHRTLPAFASTTIEFTPPSGRTEFSCGMGMLRGAIVAR